MIVNAISGASASVRKSKSLEPYLEHILDEFEPMNMHCNYSNSFRRKCIDESISHINTSVGHRVLLVGKSLGAIRTWWLMKNSWQYLEHKLSIRPHSRLGVVLIDPHGHQPGDGKVGSYGILGRNLPYDDKWDRDDVKIHVAYQRNKYPRGAMINGAPKTANLRHFKIDGGTHWNLTDINTQAGKECANVIRNMIGWLNE